MLYPSRWYLVAVLPPAILSRVHSSGYTLFLAVPGSHGEHGAGSDSVKKWLPVGVSAGIYRVMRALAGFG